jgi:hypothetical protein
LESLEGITDRILNHSSICLGSTLAVGLRLAALSGLVNRVIAMMRAPIVGRCLAGFLVLVGDDVLGLLGLPLGELAVCLVGLWLALRLAMRFGRALGLGSVRRSQALLEAVLQLDLALLEIFDLGHEGTALLSFGDCLEPHTLIQHESGLVECGLHQLLGHIDVRLLIMIILLV